MAKTYKQLKKYVEGEMDKRYKKVMGGKMMNSKMKGYKKVG